jgi:hypothetical protein
VPFKGAIGVAVAIGIWLIQRLSLRRAVTRSVT